MSTTPIGGLGMGRLIVETPWPTLLADPTPQPTESTRKLKDRKLDPDLGQSFLTIDRGGNNYTKSSKG